MSIVHTHQHPTLISMLQVCSARGKNKNPFTPDAFLIRYLDNKITNNSPKPHFLLSKASPLTAVETATFAKLAADNTLSAHLPHLCSSASLLCYPKPLPFASERTSRDAKFAVYNNRNFSYYGTSQIRGLFSYKNSSDNHRENVLQNDFRQYSKVSTNHSEDFISYGSFGNAIKDTFHSYGSGAITGTSSYKNYAEPVNGSDDLEFASYSDDARKRTQSFVGYTENGNGGEQSFAGYGKRGNETENSFQNYGTSSNPTLAEFTSYGEDGVRANDTFKNYANRGNNPTNTFENYGHGGDSAVARFDTYRLEYNRRRDYFQNYGKGSNGADVDFTGYDKSDNSNSDKFIGYGKGGEKQRFGFSGYRVHSIFAKYAKQGVKPFTNYQNDSLGGLVVKKRVEEGKLFREFMLKEGTVMDIPDIRDKMTERSFWPRVILSKLPFTVNGVNRLFGVGVGSSLENNVMDSVSECGRAPSQGDSKSCVGSIEDIVDFATGFLGSNVGVRTTENVNGPNGNLIVGRVNGIQGGRVTESVSSHQTLFPYLLYYCHSVPKVRVYEADLLDPKSKAKINRGVAICHLDTSAWSPSHGAFLALGSGPGQIEVCHWIFENDMTWSIGD